MSEQLAVIPLSDWQDIVDSVRGKTGKSEPLVSGEVADEIDSISTGASHSDYINPEWTSWSYFNCNNNRDSLVAKLKYEDTSNGTDFSYMFYLSQDDFYIPPIDTSNGTIFSNMFYGCSFLKNVPTALNTSKGTAFDGMFKSCERLKTFPSIDTSGGTNFKEMFYNCTEAQTIPNLNTSKGTDFNGIFRGCKLILTAPDIDTSNGTNFSYMFYGCTNVETIPTLNVSKGNSFSGMFQNCLNLKHLTFEGTFKITNNLFLFTGCPELTVDSLMSFINALSDNTGFPTTYKVTIGSTNLAKLTPEQIQIATDKNITLA